MTQEDKKKCINIAAEWLALNLPEEDREFWVKDFVDYLDIML